MKTWQKMALYCAIGIAVPFELYDKMSVFDRRYGEVLEYANDYISNHSRKIRSESELLRLLKEKKKKYNFNGKIIPVIDSSGETETAESYKNDDGSYTISLSEESLTEADLEHEVYHIVDGHCENISEIPAVEYIKYEYYQEPKTMLHTFFESKK
jgi:hypothetical protein